MQEREGRIITVMRFLKHNPNPDHKTQAAGGRSETARPLLIRALRYPWAACFYRRIPVKNPILTFLICRVEREKGARSVLFPLRSEPPLGYDRSPNFSEERSMLN